MIRFNNVAIDVGVKNKKKLIAEDFTLELEKSDFTCILGPSGCGKTTLLNIIAGFRGYEHGEVLIDGYAVKESPYKLSYVFQGHNIFPWKTVRQNILFGLVSLKLSQHENDVRISLVAKDLGLYDSLADYPGSLSGGMKQRVGIARALVGNPDILLMDEPFSSLDALTAQKTRELLKKLCSRRSITIVFVTHDVDEALDLADRILVVQKGLMKTLVDKRMTSEDRDDDVICSKLKNDIYNALNVNMSE